MNKYFYIINRDGQITEIEFTEERYTSILSQWQKGGLIVLPNLGLALNSVDISKILNEEQYQSFIDSVQPKQFIKNGAWYDIKERTKPVRYEKWRELEIEEKKKLLLVSPETTPTQQEEISGWLKKYRPDCIKLSDKLRIK